MTELVDQTNHQSSINRIN